MLTDAVTDDDAESASLLNNVTDDSCGIEFIEIVPPTRDTDDPCTRDRDSGKKSAEVKSENMPAVKQEPDNVTYCTYVL